MSTIKQPNIPSIGSGVDANVRRGFDAIRVFFDKLFKENGGLATMTDLAGVGGLSDADKNKLGELDTTIPPKVTGFVAKGAFSIIILSWYDMNYKNLAYYEIYRSATSSFSGAAKVGTTQATVYSDTPPVQSLSKTYYYWVRIVSKADIVGPWSDRVSARTANDPAYMISLISATLDSITPYYLGSYRIVIPAEQFAIRMQSSLASSGVYPFIVSNTPMPDDPPGGPFTGSPAVFMDTAYIRSGTITNAQIKELAADKLFVASGTIADALIGNAEITNAMIGNVIMSNNYFAGYSGWMINKSGNAEFNNSIFRGTISATTASSGRRVEINASGLIGYNSAGSNNVLISTSTNEAEGSIYVVSTTWISCVYAYNSYYGSGVQGYAPSGVGLAGSGATGVYGTGTGTYDFYANGSGKYGPFTGTHDALCDKAYTAVQGDIVIDESIFAKQHVSNTLSCISPSYAVKQKAVLGVLVDRNPIDVLQIPVTLDEYIKDPDNIDYLFDTFDQCSVNAVGEGQINVCKDGGNIEAGDYICSSGRPGKGMKQDDDLLHNYTVAKARESVTWAEGEDDIRMIACTYHCG